jgi:AraC-like DNA-binding protein
MDEIYNQRRIVSIHQMLFEMARGNFNSRIPESKEKDELETVVVLINMVAEEIKGSLFEFVNTHNTQDFVTQSTLTLDSNYMISSLTSEIILFLGYGENELIGQPLSAIISRTSFDHIHKIFDGGIQLPAVVAVDFITKTQLSLAVSCSVGQLIPRSEIILNLVIPRHLDTYHATVAKNGDEKQIKPRKVDAFLIQKLYDYILANLDAPLPSLQVLAQKFGTNEYKLKAGFRHFFKTSIYKFYNEERLKKAYFMVEHTVIPLKNISVMNGFNNYSNFSKSFKKRFGFSPYELKRNEDSLTSSREEPDCIS